MLVLFSGGFMKVRLIFRVSLSIAALLVGCSSSNNGQSLSSAISGLDSLPSVASMVKGSGVNGSYANYQAHSFTHYPLSLHVSGTPPLLTEITDSTVNKYFWNGLITTINNTSASNITEEMRSQFYGSTVGGPGGHGTCFQAQSVGESFDRMLEAGTSLCYMRNVPKASSGVTVSSGVASDIFKSSATNKTIKVTITGMDQGEDVFIKVHGTESSGNSYNVDLWFCNGSTITDYESVRVNKDTGVFTASHAGRETWEGSTFQFQSEVAAGLKVAADGTVTFDPAVDRTATAYFGKVGGSGTDSGTYKGYVAINSKDWIYAKRYSKYSFTDHTNSLQSSIDKNYSISAFSGDSLKKLRFLQAAFKGAGQWGGDSHTYSGASEFQEPYYVAIASSDLKTEVDVHNFSTDTFFTNLTPAEFSSSSYSCSATADLTVTIDMRDSELQRISQTCEQDRFREYNMCWGTAVQSAQRKINEHF